MDRDELRRRAVGEIAGDRRRGASELARRALALMAESARDDPALDAAELREGLFALAGEMAAARPSMVPIANLVGAWRESVVTAPSQDVEDLRRLAIREADRFAARSLAAVDAAGRAAARRIGPGKRIITLSASSTVRAAFHELAEAGVTAIVGESRPGCEGRDTARFLAGRGIETELVTDAQLGHFAGHADAALVGADAVLADGSVVNKAGTYLLALAARDRGIPFFVCCESFKRTPDAVLPLEEMSPEEVLPGGGGNPRPRNLYFDVTPAALVTEVIDEGSTLQSADP